MTDDRLADLYVSVERTEIDRLRRMEDGLYDLLGEEPKEEVDPTGIPYKVAIPWRDRIRDLLSGTNKDSNES